MVASTHWVFRVMILFVLFFLVTPEIIAGKSKKRKPALHGQEQTDTSKVGYSPFKTAPGTYQLSESSKSKIVLPDNDVLRSVPRAYNSSLSQDDMFGCRPAYSPFHITLSGESEVAEWGIGCCPEFSGEWLKSTTGHILLYSAAESTNETVTGILSRSYCFTCQEQILLSDIQLTQCRKCKVHQHCKRCFKEQILSDLEKYTLTRCGQCAVKVSAEQVMLVTESADHKEMTRLFLLRDSGLVPDGYYICSRKSCRHLAPLPGSYDNAAKFSIQCSLCKELLVFVREKVRERYILVNTQACPSCNKQLKPSDIKVYAEFLCDQHYFCNRCIKKQVSNCLNQKRLPCCASCDRQLTSADAKALRCPENQQRIMGYLSLKYTLKTLDGYFCCTSSGCLYIDHLPEMEPDSSKIKVCPECRHKLIFHLMADATLPLFVNEADCECCFESLVAEDIDVISQLPCKKHLQCNSCLKQHVEACLKDNLQVACTGCKIRLYDRHITTVSKELSLRVRYQWCRLLALTQNNYYACTQPGCEYADKVPVMKDIGFRIITCPCCHSELIFQKPSNKGMVIHVKAWEHVTVEDLQYIEQRLATGDWKLCPRCRNPIEKGEGCKHMTCNTCRYEFCWICQGRWYGKGADRWDTGHNGCDLLSDTTDRERVLVLLPVTESEALPSLISLPRRKSRCPCSCVIL